MFGERSALVKLARKIFELLLEARTADATGLLRVMRARFGKGARMRGVC